jgi:hypothetical protein
MCKEGLIFTDLYWSRKVILKKNHMTIFEFEGDFQTHTSFWNMIPMVFYMDS